jgi:hypothetical protein
VLVLLQLALAFRVALSDEWSEIRLAPTIAMSQGVPLWQPYGEGPILDAVYGPGAPVTWLPASLASTPAGAISIALLLSLVLLLVPTVWILFPEARHHLKLLAATLLLGIALQLSSPALPSLGIHADFPALGYATAALACAWTDRRRNAPAWQWTGAAFVIASVSSKQVMVPLLVAYPMWIGIASGWRAARQALVPLAVIGALAAGLVILLFDEMAMIDATIVGVSRQPFDGSSPLDALLTAALEFARRAAPFVVLLALAGSLVRRQGDSWQEIAQKNRWLFPLLVGLFLLPTALLSDAKVGGVANALGFTLWFLWLALLSAAASAGRSGPEVLRRVTVGAALAGCALAVRLAPDLAELPALLRMPPASTVAYEAARQAPGTIYFPYNPLASLFAEGRAYHLDPGVQFRAIEGRRMDESLVREHVPPAMNRVAASRQLMPRVLEYLPAFRRQVHDPVLPGWIVLTESDVLDERERPAPPTVAGLVPEAIRTSLVRLPTRGATVETAELVVPDRDRRPTVRLRATLAYTLPHETVDVETLLYDPAGRYLLTLVADPMPGTSVTIEEDWPVYSDVLRSAAEAVVLVRGGRPSGQEAWSLSPEQVRALVRQARSLRNPE